MRHELRRCHASSCYAASLCRRAIQVARRGGRGVACLVRGGRPMRVDRKVGGVVMWLASLAFWAGGISAIAGVDAAEVSRIPAGVIVENRDGEHFNRVLLVAKPQLASGDVDAVPASIAEASTALRLTIMATVSATTPSRHQLLDVGVGYSVPIRGQLTVVDVAGAKRLGASLGFVQRQILSRHQSRLVELRVIAATSNLFLFDAPAIFRVGNRQVAAINRHLVWIEIASGRLFMATWWYADKPGGRSRLSPTIRIVPERTREVRRIHVDRDEFFIGLPTDRAFALVDLPPGDDLEWTPTLRRVASSARYDKPALKALIDGLNRAIADRDDTRERPDEHDRQLPGGPAR